MHCFLKSKLAKFASLCWWNERYDGLNWSCHPCHSQRKVGEEKKEAKFAKLWSEFIGWKKVFNLIAVQHQELPRVISKVYEAIGKVLITNYKNEVCENMLSNCSIFSFQFLVSYKKFSH